MSGNGLQFLSASPLGQVLLLLVLSAVLFVAMVGIVRMWHRYLDGPPRPTPQSNLGRARSDLERLYRMGPPEDRR